MANNKIFGGNIFPGATSFSHNIVLRKTADNTEQTGKVAADMTGSYWRQGGVRVAITLSDLAAVNSAYSSGGVKEVDATNQPGLYRLDLPDAGIATGADWVVISIKVTGCYMYHERLTLNAVLPQADSGATGGVNDVAKINGIATTSVTTVNANQGTTQPINFTGTAGSALAKTDMVDVAGAAVSTSTAQIGVNAVQLGATAQTGRDIGASVLLAADQAVNVTKVNGTAQTARDLGLALPAVAAGASGGLLISGSNAGTTTLAALTVTGATIHTGNVSMAAGLTITQSTTNGAGLSVTGNGTGHGILSTSGSGVTGNGIQATSAATNGSGLATTGNGTGNGLLATGGAGAGGDGIEAAAGGGVPIRGDITGNLSGSAGSVTAAVTVGTINANVITAASINGDAITAAKIADGAIDAATFAAGAIDAAAIATDALGALELAAGAATEIAVATAALILVTPANKLTTDGSGNVTVAGAGAGLTAIPWNASWDTEVQSEVDDALVAQRLDELVNADSDIDGAQPPVVGSVFHELMTKTAGSFTYDQTTDSLEALRDNTGTAGAGLTAIGTIATVTTVTNMVTANAIQISGDSAAADNAEAFFDGTGYAGTNNVIPTVTTLTNAPVDSSGTTTLLARLTSGRAGNLDNLDVTVSSRLATAGYTAPPSAASISTTVWDELTATARTGASFGQLIKDDINAKIGDVKTQTDKLTFTVANKLDSSVRDWMGSTPNVLISGRADASVGAMAANVITATAINADAITAAKIADGAIDAATFAAGAIDAAAIATDAIGALELAAGAASEIATATAALILVTPANKLATDGSGRAGLDWSNIGAPTTTVGLTGTTISTAQVAASVTAAVTVGTINANAINAAAIATDALAAAKFASDAKTKLRSIVSGTAQSGSTTTLVDSARTEADTDYWKGSFLLVTSGTSSGQVRLITGFNAATDTVTFAPALTQAIGTNTYEILPAARADVGLWNGTLPNVLVSGRVDASAGAVAADVITAAAIANGAIDAATFATGAIDATAFAQGAADKVWGTATRALTDKSNFGVSSLAADTITAASLATDAGTELGTAVWATAVRDLTVKTGFSLVQAFPANFADLAVTATTGRVTAGTVIDKTGYSLTQTFPTNFADLAITATTGRVIAGTVIDKTGYALTSGEEDAIVDKVWDELKAAHTTPDSFGDYLDDEVSAGGATPPTAADIADAVWEETLADHSGTSGSTAAALNAAGSAGDPWATVLPGSYGANTAGNIIGNRLDVGVGTRLATAGYTAPPTALANGTAAATAILITPANLLATDVTGRVTVGTNADKTGYALSQAFPANFADLAVTATTGRVTVGTNADKTGYALTQAFPSNFSALEITAAGKTTVGTNDDKTGYSLSQAFPSNFADLAITPTTGRVTAGTVSDKTGYSLTQAFPTNFADLAITATTGRVTVGSNVDKTGYALTSGEEDAIVDKVWDELKAAHTVPDSFGDYLDDEISAGGGGGPSAADIADAVWDELLAGHLTGGSAAVALAAAGSAGDPWATNLPGSYTGIQAGKIIGDNLNATISSRASQASVDVVDDFLDTEIGAIKAKTDNLPAAPANETTIQASLATISGFIDTEVASILAAVDTEVGAIKAKTDNLPASPASETTLAAVKLKTDNLPTDPADESSIQATLAVIDNFIDTEISAIQAKTDLLTFTGTSLHAHVKATDNLALTVQQKLDVNTEADAALLDAGYTVARAAKLDQLDASISSRAAAATALSTVQWTNGRATNLDNLDALISSRHASGAAVAAVTGNVNGNVLGNVAGNVVGTIGDLAVAAKASVNAEVVDVFKVDTIPDRPVGPPPTTPTFEQAISYTYLDAVGKQVADQAAGERRLYNKAGAIIAEGIVSDLAGVTTVEALA